MVVVVLDAVTRVKRRTMLKEVLRKLQVGLLFCLLAAWNGSCGEYCPLKMRINCDVIAKKHRLRWMFEVRVWK